MRHRSRSWPLAVAVALAACNEPGVRVTNDAPEARIVDPANGAEVPEGQPVTLVGAASDSDDRESDLEARWRVDGADACGWAAAADDGTTTCDVVFTATSAGAIVLEVRDPRGADGSDRATLVVLPTDAPTATITAPDAAGVYYSDQLVTLAGVVADTEDPADALTVAWTSSRDADLSGVDVTPTTDGTVTGTSLLPEGQQELRLTVTDTLGKTGSDTVTITVGPPNSAPDCALVAPEDGGGGAVGALVRLDGTVSDADVPADRLSVTFESNRDGVLDTLVPDTDGTVSLALDDLSVGAHTLTMTAVDEVGATCTDSAIFTVNTPPTAGTLVLTPDPARTDDDLLAVWDVPPADADGDDLTVTWAWQVDGAPFDADAEVLPALHTRRGQRWTVTATVGDGLHTADPVSASIVVQNTVPVLASLALLPTAPASDEALTCVPGATTDPDGDAVDLTFRWELDGGPHPEAGDTLAAGSARPGQAVQCFATPADDADAGLEVASPVRVVENTAPEVAGARIAPDPAVTTDDLTCIAEGVADRDDDPVVLAVTWTLDGVDAGVDAEVLPADRTARDVAVRCTVTPSDGAADGAPVVSDPVVVANSVPSVGAVEITPGDPTIEDDLTCGWSGFADADADADRSRLEWLVDGVPAGADPVLAAGRFSADSTVTCRVTPSDGTDDGVPVEASIDIGNAAPSIAAVTLSPLPATVDTTLECAWSGYADPDGDPDRSTLAWTVDGVPAGDAPTLADAFGRGDTVRCTVTPFDGIAAGTPVFAETGIANAAPGAATVAIDPDPALTADPLTAEVTAPSVDPDGDPVTYRYAWSVDGDPAGIDLPTVDPALTRRGETWTVAVTPTDADLDGPVAEATVAIGNTPPVLAAVTLGPDPATVESVLTCAPGVATDADDDPVALRFAWEVDGLPTADDGPTLAAPAAGTPVVCIVTPDDHTDLGAPVRSNTVIIDDTPPEVTEVTLGPVDPTEASELTCAATGTDVDGDPVVFAYTWAVDGLGLDAEGPRLTGAHFDKHQAVVCTATPDGGVGVDSDAVVVQNTPPVQPPVTLGPPGARSGDVLACDAPLPTDLDPADAALLTQAVVWTADGDPVPGADPGLDTTGFPRGTAFVCTVTPADPDGPGTPVESLPLVLDNTPPTAADVAIAPVPSLVGEELTCSWTFADVDADPDRSTVEWFVDDVLVADGPGWLAAGVGGETVVCRVTPHDGVAAGDPVEASVVLEPPCLGGGDRPYCPGLDCLDILERGHAVGDGLYWIDPFGDGAFPVLCDMVTDGGGWTVLFEVGEVLPYDPVDAESIWFWGRPLTGPADAGGLDVDRWSHDGEAATSYVEERDTTGDYSQPAAWAMVADQWIVGAPSLGDTRLDVPAAFTDDVVLAELPIDPPSECPDAVDYAAACPALDGCGGVPGYTCEDHYERLHVAFNHVRPASGTVCRLSSGYDDDAGFNDIPHGMFCDGHGGPQGLLRHAVAPGFRLMGRRTPVCDGQGDTAGCLGLDCLDILERGYSDGDGVYWIDPDGAGAIEVHCDMTTDGGGWTRALSLNPARMTQYDSGTVLEDQATVGVRGDENHLSAAFYRLSFTASAVVDTTHGVVVPSDVASDGTPLADSIAALADGVPVVRDVWRVGVRSALELRSDGTSDGVVADGDLRAHFMINGGEVPDIAGPVSVGYRADEWHLLFDSDVGFAAGRIYAEPLYPDVGVDETFHLLLR